MSHPSSHTDFGGAIQIAVHPTAVIDESARLGQGTRVWHFCHVCAEAVIGERCVLGQNVYVGPQVKIGSGTKIQNNVSVYSGVTLGQDVFVGPSVVFTNVKTPRASVDRSAAFVPTRVERGASIGANATIVCGVTLGEYCSIGAGAVVTRDVPAYALVVGNPARVVGRVDRQGERIGDSDFRGDQFEFAEDGGRGAPETRHGPGATRGGQGSPATQSRVKLLDPVKENAPFQRELEAAALSVLRSGQFIQGPAVERFERRCAAELGVEHAIGVKSGSDALLVALMAAGVGPGDEVITTPYSFFATVGAILRLGAVPRFVDIGADGFLIDTSLVEAAITERTRAFIPVHLFGQALDLSALRPTLQARGVAVIEDAAQAFLTRGDCGTAGQGGLATCFSFFPSKNLGGFGDAGLVTTRDPAFAERVRLLRAHGARPKYHHQEVGGNFRLDSLQAALLDVKLDHARALLDKRRENAQFYLETFASLTNSGELRLPEPGHLGHSYNQFVVRSNHRDALRQHLNECGIDTAIYYPEPLHRQPALSTARVARSDTGLDSSSPSFENCERACQTALALPIHPALTRNELLRVSAAVIEFFAPSRSAPAEHR